MLRGDLSSNLEGMKITIRGLSKNCICKVGGKIALLIKRLLLFNHSQPFGTEGLITILAQEYNCFLYRPYTCIAFMFLNKMNLDSDFLSPGALHRSFKMQVKSQVICNCFLLRSHSLVLVESDYHSLPNNLIRWHISD